MINKIILVGKLEEGDSVTVTFTKMGELVSGGPEIATIAVAIEGCEIMKDLLREDNKHD